jgi:S-layer homology domain
VTTISQFSDVRPGDWADQSLADLVTRYGCVAGEPDGRFAGGRALSRYEAAALLQACLERISEQTDSLEALRFSTTTKLTGLATVVVGSNVFSGTNRPLLTQARSLEGGTTFNMKRRPG